MGFKDTEVGRIPEEWEVLEIGEIGDVVGGGTPKTSIEEYWDGEISWITPKDLSGYTERCIYYGERSITKKGLDNSSAKIIPKGTVLFSSRAPIGYLAIAGKDMCTNQGFKSIVCDDKKVHNIFLYYLMMIKRYELENIAGGSTFKEVSGKTVKEFKVPIPPINEQKAIAHILSTLDEKIEVNNQINKKLEEMAQTIFKHWFVDFEFPNGNGEPYKSSGGEMVDSEFGMIPKGWEVKTIEDVTDAVSKGTTPTKKDIDTSIDEAIINFLKVKDIDDEGNISMNTLEKIPNSIHLNKLKRSILKKWDILFSIAGTIGRVATVDSRLDNSNANQAIAFIRLKEVEKMFVFILYLLKSENIQNEIKANVVQAVQANASLGTIKSLKYTLPTDNIIKKFNRIVFPIYNKQTNIRIESEQLTQLRDTLLPKLMSGELRIPLEEDDIS